MRAALDKVPQLDPADVDDLMLGCGLPGGRESGFDVAGWSRCSWVMTTFRAASTRYCSSSLQTTRMAMRAMAGEGQVFVSTGVETVSRHVLGSGGLAARHHEPR